MTLGEIVKEYRKENNLTMDDFATRSTLSKGYISMLEKNRNPKNNKPIVPGIDTFQKVAHAMNINVDLLVSIVDKNQPISLLKELIPVTNEGITINVLGRVAAGVPIEACEDIIGTEHISSDLAKTGTYFGLKIKGDSMSPRICEGDIVIVRQQEDAEEGDIVIALINGHEATCKRLHKYCNGIRLIPINQSYEPLDFSNKEIAELPVSIIGKVVENRQKF